MKTSNTLTSCKYAVPFFVLLLVMACGGKNNTPQPPSAQDQAKTLLTAGTWKLQSESVDGVDQTASFSGFTIIFTSSGFTTTNGGGIWPASGSWSFQGTSATSITRNDNTEVQIQPASSSLVMTINWTVTTLGSGRAASTKGKNVFTMTK